MKVLFICIGNSCRSPMAEAILRDRIAKNPALKYWETDSAALANWNVGLEPEPRCLSVLKANGISTDHRARQIAKSDFYNFNYIFGMDEWNMKTLNELTPADATAVIQILRTYDPEGPGDIEDPYFSEGTFAFFYCYKQISRCIDNFIVQHSPSGSNS